MYSRKLRQSAQTTPAGVNDQAMSSHDDILSLLGTAVVAALVAVDLIGLLGSREILHHSPGALALEVQGAEADAHVAHLAPVLTPRVAHDPIATVHLVLAPADNRDDVVDVLARLGDDAALEVEQG